MRARIAIAALLCLAACDNALSKNGDYQIGGSQQQADQDRSGQRESDQRKSDQVKSDQVKSGQLGRFIEMGPFAVEGLPDQRLTIWLPPGYADNGRQYPVLYMHDGHNLFDPAKSNFNKIWAVDKAILALVGQARIEPHIVVGIWAPGDERYRQYLPNFLTRWKNPGLQSAIDRLSHHRPNISARYLNWIADELKPRIDRDYRTLAAPAHTAIAGSSMGGLISCYAIVERPDIFGRAACVSTHWPVVMPEYAAQHGAYVQDQWRRYFQDHLGDPMGRRIWMDHGTATLDSHYPPYQAAIDASFVAAGWERGRDWTSREYIGAQHDEDAWAQRLPEILEWLLADFDR